MATPSPLHPLVSLWALSSFRPKLWASPWTAAGQNIKHRPCGSFSVSAMFQLKGYLERKGIWFDKLFNLTSTFVIKDDGTFLALVYHFSSIAFTKKEKNKIVKLLKKIKKFIVTSYIVRLDDSMPNKKLKLNWKYNERTFISGAKLKYRKISKTKRNGNNVKDKDGNGPCKE